MKEVSKRLGIPYTTISTWKNSEGGEQALGRKPGSHN
ncbi:MAG: hypothetical protein DRG25_05625, partial [Deltaproteobacteria bacterium]